MAAAQLTSVRTPQHWGPQRHQTANPVPLKSNEQTKHTNKIIKHKENKKNRPCGGNKRRIPPPSTCHRLALDADRNIAGTPPMPETEYLGVAKPVEERTG